MKECIICNKEKSLDQFYKHKQMSDGRLNKCKECCKSQAQENHHKKSNDPEWIEKERARHREKYSRLGYKEKQKVWDEKRPWKQTSTYKNLHRDLKIPQGIAAHHWCYNEDKLKDVLLMDYKQHKSLHQLLELDYDKRVFKVKETGLLLDNRNKHILFIVMSGFGFVEYNKNINYTLVGLNANS